MSSYQSYGFSLLGVTAAMRCRCAQLPVPLARTWQGGKTVAEYDRIYRHVAVDEKRVDLVGWATMEGESVVLESILSQVLAWKQAGKKTTLRRTGSDGVIMTSGFRILDDKVAEIEATNGDLVFLMAGTSNLQGLQFHQHVAEWMWRARNEDNSIAGYEQLHFPAVSIDAKYKIKDLIGAGCGVYRVVRAEQTIEFNMDEKGARVKAHTRVEMRKCLPRAFVIDGSFMVAILRPGCAVPYFVAKFTF